MSIIRADSIKNRTGAGAPDFPNGITVTGVITATTLNQNVSGVSTFSGDIDLNGDIDVDGHTNLDNVNVAGVTTFAGGITGTTGTFSGNVSIGGTLTYEDVTSIDSVGIVTARLGVRVPDDVYSYFGTGNDLSIRHDAAGGNHSYIFNTGAGVLKIGSNTQFLIGKTTNVTYIEANPDGDVKLYHNNSSKLATTSTGVTVTGTVTDTKGELRNVPQVTASSNLVIVSSHAGKHILHSGTGGWTINTSTGFAVGDMVTFINHSGSAQTIFQAGGVTLYDTADGATGDHSVKARGIVTAINVASNVFYLSGNIA